MRKETVLRRAEFDNAVNYFMVSTAVVLALTVVLIPALPIVLPLVYIFKTIEYKRIECTLLERSLRVKRGVFNKVEKTIPLDKITDLGINQGPIMRHCGVEAIAIETAGQSGAGSALVNLVGIKNAEEFRDAVLDQRDALADGKVSTAPAASETQVDAGGSGDVLREIRDSLLRIESSLSKQPSDADSH